VDLGIGTHTSEEGVVSHVISLSEKLFKEANLLVGYLATI
jgi:hypothetical protein